LQEAHYLYSRRALPKKGRKIRDLSRSAPKKNPKPKLIFVCEGANTEPRYLKALGALSSWAIFDIKPIPAAGVPATIAQKAVDLEKSRDKEDSFSKHDEVWAVFDRDEHPKFKESVNLCDASGVRLGISNPCFELWLILHLEDFDKPDGRHDLQSHCKKLFGGKECKDKSFRFDELVKHFDLAAKRAKKQHNRRIDEANKVLNPPYTTLYLLKETYLKNSKVEK